MTPRKVDLGKLRAALRRMRRGELLIVAERAIESVSRTKLKALVGDLVRLDDLTEGKAGAGALVEEVRAFHAESLAREYYDSFGVDSKNFMNRSEGTEAFIAEFDRLLRKCITTAKKRPDGSLREAFDLLFGLLRQIDSDPDSILFFADDGGTWEIWYDWRAALAAYFPCLASSASGEEFAREVDRAIADFAEHERPRHLTAARRAANAEQKAALKRLPARRRKR